jgi:hypothetical protein
MRRIERIADGNYKFWLVSAEPVGDELLVVTFQVMSGEREALGRSLACCFHRSGEQVHALRLMLEACGWKVPRRQVRLDLDKLIGKECAGTVTEDSNGRAVISAFFPVADLELTQMSQIAPEPRQRYVM